METSRKMKCTALPFNLGVCNIVNTRIPGRVSYLILVIFLHPRMCFIERKSILFEYKHANPSIVFSEKHGQTLVSSDALAVQSQGLRV